jgi:type I restriction enzyme, S subunit
MTFHEILLGDFITLKRGYDLPNNDRKDGVVPVVSSSGVTGIHSEPKVKGPGVVTGRYGTLGEVFFIEQDFWPLNTALYVQDFKGNNPRFVSYFLRKELMGLLSDKAAVPGVNRNDLHARKVFTVTDQAVQEQIADVLCHYDDLITNNTRRIELLERSARLLFKEWFIRLRYPGHEHEKIINGMPAGWERKPLSEFCARITDGSHSSPHTTEFGMPMASVKDMREWDFEMAECRLISEEDYLQLVRNDCKPLKGDILIAKDSANLNKHTFLVAIEREMVVLSSIAIIRPLDSVNAEYMMSMLKSPEVSERIKRNVSGVAIPRIVLKDFKRLPVMMPTRKIQDAWEEMCGPMNELCRSLSRANAKLANARNLLLPRLMDGRIEVYEI